jgi:deazaflavin-dependent oxidoreductase (nitroreductase family)
MRTGEVQLCPRRRNGDVTGQRPRPAPWAVPIFDAPSWLYSHGMGWMLGRRFLEVTHIGRRSGKERFAVLEVIKIDPTSGESTVASAFGPKADWYQNLQKAPAVRIRQGRREYVPEQRFLDADERRQMAAEFATAHPFEARVANRVMAAIGAVPLGTYSNAVDLFASFPMVAFRPRLD